MMRLISIAACLSASTLAFAAHAQVADPATSPAPSTNQPSTSQLPAPADQAPPPAASPAPADQPPPAAYSANATPPGAVMQMAPPQPVVQNAPQPTGEYPRCSRTVTDACTNPGSR